MKLHHTTYLWLAGGLIGLVITPVSIATATSAETTSEKAATIPQAQSPDQFAAGTISASRMSNLGNGTRSACGPSLIKDSCLLDNEARA